MIRRPQLMLVIHHGHAGRSPTLFPGKKSPDPDRPDEVQAGGIPGHFHDGELGGAYSQARPWRSFGAGVFERRDKGYNILLGEKPVISHDGNWVAAAEVVPAELLLKSKKGKDKENGPKPGMVLLNTSTGEQEVFESIRSFQFSNDSRRLLYLESQADAKKKTGTTLTVKSLADTTLNTYDFVTHYALDSMSRYLAYMVADTNGIGNGVYVVDLENSSSSSIGHLPDSSAWADQLSWNKRNGQLAFLAGIPGEKEKREDASLYLWAAGQDGAVLALDDSELEEGWKLYHTNALQWSRDGQSLYLGLKPQSEFLPEEEEIPDSIRDLFDTEQILSERGVDVWHWNDPFISTHQKVQWKREKDRTYKAVYHPVRDQLVQLADQEMPDIRISESSRRLLGSSNVPYAREVTWDGRYRDYYLVDLASGERKLVLERQGQTAILSPDGDFLAYYRDGDWFLLNAASLEIRNLTGSLEVPFADEDWDYPEEVPGYGTGGWMEGSSAVLIYDKYDIWQFSTSDGEAVCLTEGKGRREKYQFRIKTLTGIKKFLEKGEATFTDCLSRFMKIHGPIFDESRKGRS